jgi:uncharacterized protein YecE (DUF72 family)
VVRIGCSGWSYEHWRGVVYPAKGSASRWLELYAASLDTVEVNATFYRLPDASVVARWAQVTPPGFSFAVKTSRYLTHVKRLRDVGPGFERLATRIEPLHEAGKLGPLLWQLPQTFHRDDARLAEALEGLPPGRHAFEFRHESWFDEDVYRMLRRHRAALVVADRAPKRPTPWVETTTWSYVRLHRGHARDGSYGRDALRRLADRIRRASGDVYVYFNNDWQGFAFANARTLRELVDRG